MWEAQGVGNKKVFLNIFKQRLHDCYLHEWHDSVITNSKLEVYCNIKELFDKSEYLEIVREKKFRSALSKFICSNHPLAIETGRQAHVYQLYPRVKEFVN